MKKTSLFIVALLIGLLSFSQDAFYISAGATAVRRILIPSVDVGVKFNKNKLSFNVQTYDINHTSFSRFLNHVPDSLTIQQAYHRYQNKDRNPDRVYIGNVRYTRIIKVAGPVNLVPNVTSGIVLRDDVNTARFLFTGGVGIELKLARNLYLQTVTQFPVIQNKKEKFKYPSVQNGLLLTYNLF